MNSPQSENRLAELLRRNCEWQRAQGTTRDNGYPYHKHVPDCDICRAADALENGDKITGRAFARQVKVEQYLLDCANGKRELPDRDKCRELARRLGVEDGK